MSGKLAGGLLAVILCAGFQAAAADAYVLSGMADKGVHGIVNVATCWVEIPVQTGNGYRNGLELYNPDVPACSRTTGTLRGFLRGTYHGVGRLGLGLYQTFGFWAANHESNDGIGLKLNAEYAWEEGLETAYDKVSRGQCLSNRYERGFLDLFGGLLEFPLQMHKGFTERDALSGFFRGVWFTGSRLYSGLYDIIGLPLPNGVETEGFAFEQERAWEHDD